MKRVARTLTAIFALGWALLLAAADMDYGLAPEQIAPDTWVLTGRSEDFSTQNGGNIVNTAFVVTSAGVLVIDSFSHEWAGEGGVLVPVASVDKFPEALASFADLNAETAAHGIAWNVLFVAAMNREENEGPDQIAAVDQTLEAMVSAIKAGQVDSFVPFDPSGTVVAMGA